MSLVLRPYQNRVADELWEWFRQHPTGNPIVEACVAAGKSVIMAFLAWSAMTRWPGTRIIVVVHQKELLKQNVDKLRRIWPDAPVGIWSAAIGIKQIGDITFATIGSIYKHAHLLGRIALVFCDECHLVNPKEEGMWRAFLGDLKRYGNPTVRVVGFTGTPFRGNGVWLTSGDDALFTHIVSRIKIQELLDLGFLAPLLPATAPELIDATSVKVTGDDYNLKDLAKLADTPDVVTAACRSIVSIGRAGGRRKWLIFAINISHAEHIRDGLVELGVRADVVTGKTPAFQRDEMLNSLRSTEPDSLEAMVNVGVLTTGFDAPWIDYIALLRPTKSKVLYVQMAGRGLRVIGEDIHASIAAGKSDCLFADFTNTVRALGPVDAITGKKGRRATGGHAPFKICDNCGSQCKIQDRACPECGAEFEVVEAATHGDAPSGAAMLSSQLEFVQKIKQQRVTHAAFALYAKDGKKTSVMVSYMNGVMRVASEWIHFEQPFGSPPRSQARQWWLDATGSVDAPGKSGDALDQLVRLRKAGVLRSPKELVLDETGKYPTIVRKIYGDEGVDAGQTGGVACGNPSPPKRDEVRDPARQQVQLQDVRSLSKWVV